MCYSGCVDVNEFVNNEFVNNVTLSLAFGVADFLYILIPSFFLNTLILTVTFGFLRRGWKGLVYAQSTVTVIISRAIAEFASILTPSVAFELYRRGSLC